jgi:glyoxylase-like metal-dependent hydrolase (beta-lactamase superfamily II)
MIQHRSGRFRLHFGFLGVLTFAAFTLTLASVRLVVAGPLALEVYTADSKGLGVTSTLIYGEHSAMLVDAQFRISDAEKLADLIAAKGRPLKAILLTHPHADHYFGTAVLLKRFPGTPVYASAADVEYIKGTVAKSLAGFSKEFGADNIPAEIPVPQVLPTTHFALDGEAIDVMIDLQGDVAASPLNNVVWVPSLSTAIVGDIVFNERHMFLAGTSDKSRKAWLETLRTVSGLHPGTVIAGHKNTPDLPDSPEILARNETYIEDFGAALAASHTASDLVAAMKQKYPQFGGDRGLSISAKTLFPE